MLQKQQISEQNVMATMLKAMAHPERLAILKVMCCEKDDRLSVKFIYENLGLQQPVASRHLNILKHAGIIKREQEGQKIYYSLCVKKETITNLFKRLL